MKHLQLIPLLALGLTSSLIQVSLKLSCWPFLQLIISVTKGALKLIKPNITVIRNTFHLIYHNCYRNGADQTGLFIAASIVFDMLATTETVDFVQTVKQIRKNRPQFITDLV